MIEIPDNKLPKELRRQKLVIFIDGNHLFHRTKYWYGTHDVEILEFSKRLSTVNREIIQIRYYYSPFIEQVDKRNYLKQDLYVKKINSSKKIELISGKYIKKPIILPEEMMNKLLEHFEKGDLYSYVEKGIDVHISTDMVSFAQENKFQDMILVSGDSDFVPAITEVRKLHKKVQVAAYRDEENSCSDLTLSASSFINLHNIMPKLLERKKKATTLKS